MHGSIKRTQVCSGRRARVVLIAAVLFLLAIPIWMLYLGPVMIVRHIHAHQVRTVEWFCRLGVSSDRDAWLVGGVFHCAVASGDTNLVAIMLKRRADVNRIDGYGETPLHVATKTGDLQMMRFLIEHGADPRKRNRDGMTPLETAKQRNVEEARRYLDENRNDANKHAHTNEITPQ
jgi:hypothetical protein